VRRAAAAFASLALLGACTADDDAGTERRLPELEVEALDGGGQALDLGELGGPAVVNLWATWCKPCREELPAFQQVAAARDDVRFVGINSQERGDARAYLDELGVTYDQFVDARGRLAEELGAAALPVTVVLAADGTIAVEHLGPMSVSDLEAALDAAGA
jgi:cytochrome c biogenesis protein CcmG/thiol:disulfide interchange protein DsbE